MSLKFVNYAAFAAAGKQVDRDMKEFRQTYGTDARKSKSIAKVGAVVVKGTVAPKRASKR